VFTPRSDFEEALILFPVVAVVIVAIVVAAIVLLRRRRRNRAAGVREVADLEPAGSE
jgi:uncharacterized membrane protein YhiD involved in acid resistance